MSDSLARAPVGSLWRAGRYSGGISTCAVLGVVKVLKTSVKVMTPMGKSSVYNWKREI